jgi:hypothetical protein
VGVPDDIHRSLKSQAAAAGQSLNEFLLARLEHLAGPPTVLELADRIRQLPPYTGPSIDGVIREERDRR